MSKVQIVERTPAVLDFENLFINNSELGRIEAYLKRFNPIKTMGMQHMEIRHSSILGWLLDPQESHGMGDQFLKAFLSAALRDGSGGHPTLRALEISQADMLDAEVRREWRSVDLLVISRSNGWVFIIENKFHSKQHGNQLTAYHNTVANVFGDDLNSGVSLDIHGVFLTLHEEKPHDARYATLQYVEVLSLLKQLVQDQSRPLSEEVKVFIKHYVEIIEEATGMDDVQNEMVKLARQLYRDHKKVLDFVVEQGTGNDFSLACETLFGVDLNEYDELTISGKQFIYSHMGTTEISFLPKSWFDAFGEDNFYWHGCENWWAGLPVICWLQLIESDEKNGAQLRLYAEVGPLVEHEFRKGLIEGIKNIAAAQGVKNVSFQKTAANEGKKYSKFLTNNSINIDDSNDSEEIGAAMESLLARFQPVFAALTDTMAQFVKYGKEASL